MAVPTRAQVLVVTQRAVLAQLMADRPNDGPNWPTNRQMGPPGTDYSFSDPTLRQFVVDAVQGMQADPVLAGCVFGPPAAIPAGTLLGGSVDALSMWLWGDICGQLAI